MAHYMYFAKKFNKDILRISISVPYVLGIWIL